MSMRISRRSASLIVVGMLTARLVSAQTTPQEKGRDEILDQLGLKKRTTVPAPEAPAPAEGGTPETGPAPGRPGAAAKEKSAGRPSGPAAPSFTRVIHPALVATCKVCHSPVGPAALSHFLLSGDAAADHNAIARLVDVRKPEASKVAAKVSGTVMHGGGAPWPPGSVPYERLLAWIRGGARFDAARAVEPPPAGPAETKTAPHRREPPANPGVTAGVSVDTTTATGAEAIPPPVPVPPPVPIAAPQSAMRFTPIKGRLTTRN